jgi:predicted ribosome quality control (RQC) complex YloA/Tae2 family protein
VAEEIAIAAGLSPQAPTETLELEHWQTLFSYWQKWLLILEHQQFDPGWLSNGYTVLGWNKIESVEGVQTLLNRYYTQEVNRQQFQQLYHQLNQKLINLLKKLNVKANTFRQRLAQSANAQSYRQQGDLLMAHLHQVQPGMKSIILNDFATGEPIKIKLNPEKNPAQNAQYLYKQSQKLKRAKDAVVPLLADVDGEIDYLSQVQTALNQLKSENTGSYEDLQALAEIKEELVQQEYLIAERQESDALNRQIDLDSQPYRLKAPSGYEIWIGRNNRQNDILTFRTAVEYDLWFHTQEIPGSHVLLLSLIHI